MRRTGIFRGGAGLLIAATGVGAGDLVISALSGARYGVTLLWAVVIGAVLKWCLNEGLARWEIATGTTLLAGWVKHLPRFLVLYFGAYLVLWACLVAGTLITYTGVVANTVFPLTESARVGTAVWGGLQSLLAAALVYFGGFRAVERTMKMVIATMFLVVIGGAVMVAPDWAEIATGLLVPSMNTDLQSVLFIFALAGGVGGTLTILCYSYWLREKREMGEVPVTEVRTDLGVAYVLTALFGIAVTVIAAGVKPDDVSGYLLVTSIAERMGEVLGGFGYWSFMLGFWAAVFTSMVGVWSGVPYLFSDLLQRYRSRYGEQGGGDAGAESIKAPLREARSYRWFLLYLAIPPILLTIFEEPAWIGVAYALAGAFFMPFLAATLLHMNNRAKWVGSLRNGWTANFILGVCLLLFLILFGVKIVDLL